MSIAVRDSELVPIRSDTQLQAGDYVIVLADPDLDQRLTRLFGPPKSSGGPS